MFRLCASLKTAIQWPLTQVQAGELVPLPDSQICNLELAVAGVSYTSGTGAVENFDQFTVYFWVSDDFLV